MLVGVNVCVSVCVKTGHVSTASVALNGWSPGLISALKGAVRRGTEQKTVLTPMVSFMFNHLILGIILQLENAIC